MCALRGCFRARRWSRFVSGGAHGGVYYWRITQLEAFAIRDRRSVPLRMIYLIELLVRYLHAYRCKRQAQRAGRSAAALGVAAPPRSPNAAHAEHARRAAALSMYRAKNLPKSKSVDWAARTLYAEFQNTTYGTLQLRQATVARNVQIVKHDPGADKEYWAATNAYFAKSKMASFTEAKQEHDRARATLDAARQQPTSLDAAGAARVLEEAKRLAEAASRTETAEHEKLKTRVLEVWGRITGGATSRAEQQAMSPALAAARQLRVDTSQAAADEAARNADGSPRSAPQRSPLADAPSLRNIETSDRTLRRNRFYGSYYAGPGVEGSAVDDNRDVEADAPGVDPMDLGDEAIAEEPSAALGDDVVAAPAPVEPLKLPEHVLPVGFFETPAQSDVKVTMDRMVDHVAHDTKLVDPEIRATVEFLVAETAGPDDVAALLKELVHEVQDSVASLTAVAPSTNPHRLLQNAALKERLKNTIIDEQPEGKSDMVQTPGGRVATVVERKADDYWDVILDENKNEEGGAGDGQLAGEPRERRRQAVQPGGPQCALSSSRLRALRTRVLSKYVHSKPTLHESLRRSHGTGGQAWGRSIAPNSIFAGVARDDELAPFTRGPFSR